MTLVQDLSIIGAVSALWLVAMVVPGLDFLLVTRLAMMRGRAAALRAAFGIALGVALWGLAGFFGIHALFVASPWLYRALKIGGGLYLFVVGVRLYRASWQPQSPAPAPADLDRRDVRAFRMGLLTNLANPKAPVFVSSLFAAALPQHVPVGLGLTCVAAMWAIAAGWFSVVALMLSLRRFAGPFSRARHWIDRVAGMTFMGIGARLATERAG
ncbi:LysE family transporter [Nguyenibacter vanlangensis]|uniref:LysE family transporter n=1 Tax=Nguyenibacter vanlangensis TaxID=1216886 RepID=A0A7Y7IYX9_9PROT|nr:LysE family transporter [Nguyenibacter vanlangensis]NVN12568.1 LysE family transporter [Nguyenibacter vanlangensis]